MQCKSPIGHRYYNKINMSAENKGGNQDIGPTAMHWERQKHIRPKVVMDPDSGEYKLTLNGLRVLPPSSPNKLSLSDSPVAFSAPGSPDEEVVHKVVVRDNQETDSKD